MQTASSGNAELVSPGMCYYKYSWCGDTANLSRHQPHKLRALELKRGFLEAALEPFVTLEEQQQRFVAHTAKT